MSWYENETYLDERPKCPKCGKAMELDDIDYNFKGNQDEYWICDDKCCMSAFVKVRYGKPLGISYTDEDGNQVKWERL
ncbi:MAG: hypothetical protein IJ301_05025 [Clostridia bacterium]|nr:hypothetical protein [Clostridia bacterium]